MSNNKQYQQQTQTAGVGFTGLLAIVFIALKLIGVITWSWLWVLAPLWIPAILVVISAIVLIVLYVIND